ncbi:MAG TPA: hypothetical protein VGM93_05310 [Acidimicrobiales bacterium]|jgi:hypothetical protein
MDTQELMDEVCPRIRDVAWAYYFVPETVARGRELGLEPELFYVLGRGGVLGDVDAAVVHSAFGYFNPEKLDHEWNAARAVVAPRDAAAAYWECCADCGRNRFGAIEGLGAFVAAADAVNAAADPMGLALYAGARTMPLADDAPARAMQLLALLRELRGSAHLVAVRASGVDWKTAHFIKRPNDGPMFGWGDTPEISEADRERWDVAEALTDDLVRPAYAILDDDQAAAFIAGLGAVEQAFKG